MSVSCRSPFDKNNLALGWRAMGWLREGRMSASCGSFFAVLLLGPCFAIWQLDGRSLVNQDYNTNTYAHFEIRNNTCVL